MRPLIRRRLAICFLLIAFTQALTPDPPDDGKTNESAEEDARRLLKIAAGTESQSDDVIVAHEPMELEGLMTGFEKNMASYKGVGDSEVRYHLNEMLYDFQHPQIDRYQNIYTHYTRLCRRLLETEHVQTRVRRSTGHLPTLTMDMEEACVQFLNDSSEENLDKLEDLDTEILQEVLCLERGRSIGVERECRSQLRGERSLFEGEDLSNLGEDMLPSEKEIDDFNGELLEYCPEKHKYDHTRMRRSASRGAMFSADVLEYMNCLCDNKTTCGHLGFKAAMSFKEDIAEPIALQMEKGVEEGQTMDEEAAREIQETQVQFVAPGNKSYEEAFKETQRLAEANRRKKRAFERIDLVKVPLGQITDGVGCAIAIHKDRLIQVFACTAYKILKLEFKLIWTNLWPRIEINLKVCIPVVSDIIDFVTKYVPPLNAFVKLFDIENGCLLIGKAYVDFYKGIFEIFSNFPQKYLVAFRSKLRSSFLIRFDVFRPSDNKKERDRLNLYGARTYMRVHIKYTLQVFEFWKLWWGTWVCMFCPTLADIAVPLGKDKRPLTESGSFSQAVGYRLAEENVKGTGRIEVELSSVYGTVCDDKFDEFSGEVFCRQMGFKGYLGVWEKVPPGKGEIHFSEVQCAGSEKTLYDCPRGKDIGKTGCDHSEDVGVQCLTDDTVCHQEIRHGEITASSGDPSQIYFDSPGGWSADWAGEAWVMIDIYFSHKISGIRTMAHKTGSNWVTEFRFQVFRDKWIFNKDANGNEKVYKGNFDGTNIKSNFWSPPLVGKQIKILIQKYNNKPAMRLELHGCKVDSMLMENAVTYQSSVLEGGFAKLAIDGNKDNNFLHGSCTHTQEELNPWWALDMGRQMKVEGMGITNRGDCCGNHLVDFVVQVGNRISLEHGAQGDVCVVHPNVIPDGETKLLKCEGTPRGRFFQIQKRGYGILALCEVEIWALPVNLDRCDVNAQDKVDCGLTDQQQCEDKGCCWNPGGYPQCYGVNTFISPDIDCMESLFVHEHRTDASASTVFKGGAGDYGPGRARLDTTLKDGQGSDYGHGGWKPRSSDENQYIQVTFPEVWSVRKIITQGANNLEEWVMRYRIYVSFDGQYWTQVGGIMQANSDSDSKAANEFKIFAAKMIRINPIESHVYPSMRLEILGCKACLVSLFNRNPNTLVTASSTYESSDSYGPNRARLGTMDTANPFGFGGWKANTDAAGEWVAVTFAGYRTVKAVILEPSQGRNEYVTRYSVRYSQKPGDALTVEGEYQGCKDEKTSVTNFIRNPFTARYVRLVVVEFVGAVTMRFDIFGCDSSMTKGLMQRYEEQGHPDLRPNLFYLEETVGVAEARTKCKEKGVKLADIDSLRRVYQQKNFDNNCKYGYALPYSYAITPTGMSVNNFESEAPKCSSVGVTGAPETESKLLGVFCSSHSHGIVYREFSECASIDDAKLMCVSLEGRLADKAESYLAFKETDYKECRNGYYQDPWSGPLVGKLCSYDIPGFQKTDPQPECVKGVYCFVPPITLGMLPPAYLRLKLKRGADLIHIYGRRYIEMVFAPSMKDHSKHAQFFLGHHASVSTNEETLVALQPTDPGVLAPAVSYQEFRNVGMLRASFLHAICPKGYRRVGDFILVDSMTDQEKNDIKSSYRCVREEFVTKCQHGGAFYFMGVYAYVHKPLPRQTVYHSFFTVTDKQNGGDDAYCILMGLTALTI